MKSRKQNDIVRNTVDEAISGRQLEVTEELILALKNIEHRFDVWSVLTRYLWFMTLTITHVFSVQA